MFLTFLCIFSTSKQIYHQLQQNPNSSKPKFSIPNKKKKSSNQRSVRVREQQNKNHQRHQRRIDPEQADRRFGETILGLTNGASRVRDHRWRMGLMMDELDDLRNGFDRRARRSEEWVRRTSSTIWEMGLRSDDLGIARQTSSVLGFLGSSELLDVNRSRLRRCWGASAISLPCCLSLSLLFSWGGSDLKWKWEQKLFSTPLNLILRSNWNHFQFDRIFSNSQTSHFPENHFRNQFEVDSNAA